MRSLLAAAVAALTIAACGSSAAPHDSAAALSAQATRFPGGGRFDYQIGGAYPPQASVRIVDRDRADRPVAGRYNVCYVNAFQTQADETSWWRTHHANLLLRDRSGHYVIDTDWNEVLLDIRTAAKRKALIGVVGAWIDGCARRGFQAVEPDNLDSYTRSHRLVTASQAVAFAALLSARAHRDHLAIAQKNAAELAVRGFDFAIAEECQVYAECGVYTKAYGRRVIEIEYAARPFAAACRVRGASISVLLRDRDVVPAGHAGYVSRWCR